MVSKHDSAHPIHANAMQKAFDISTDPHLIAVPARQLTSPNIKYQNGTAAPRNGQWNLQNQKGGQYQFTAKPQAKFEGWGCLWIRNGGNRSDQFHGDKSHLNHVLDGLSSKMSQVGIVVGKCTQVETVDGSNPSQIEDKIRKMNPRPRLLFVVMSVAEDPAYNRVKSLCDLKLGIMNICITSQTLTKREGIDQVLANIALKVNLKLGGNNHALDPEKLGIISVGKTMLVGLDVTHPSPGSSKNAPSVSGIVASIDRNAAQFPGDFRIQTGRKEMIEHLVEIFQARLQLWKKHNRGALPDNVLVYRDGVSEGQFELVVDKELQLLKKACKSVYTNPELPRITIVICGKRHHTRFYPSDGKDMHPKTGNTFCGTVVDREVTESRVWDFFMQAHNAIQGTARPAHYTVVYDEMFKNVTVPPPHANAADALQDLTHNLCYLYGRATMAVSLCPPAYYADLVCERARKYLAHLFDDSGDSKESTRKPEATDYMLHEQMRDTMFYI